jgi:hypothetical protein
VVVATAGLALGVASSRGDGRCRKVRRDGASAVARSLVVAAGPARDTAKAATPRRATRRSRTHNVSEDEQTLMLFNRPLGRVPLACACLPGCLGPKTDLRREKEADGRCHEGFNADLSDILIGVSSRRLESRVTPRRVCPSPVVRNRPNPAVPSHVCPQSLLGLPFIRGRSRSLFNRDSTLLFYDDTHQSHPLFHSSA